MTWQDVGKTLKLEATFISPGIKIKVSEIITKRAVGIVIPG